MSLNDFLISQGIDFKIERNGKIINTITGLENYDDNQNRDYIGFMPNQDVKFGDYLINPNNERFFVEETKTDYFDRKPFQLVAYIVSEYNKSKEESQKSQVIYNVTNAYGSIIGNQSNVTLNYNSTIQQLKENVAKCQTADKESLEKIVSLLEMVVNDDVPVKKGLFSKFSDVMERNSWITGSIASALISYLFSK